MRATLYVPTPLSPPPPTGDLKEFDLIEVTHVVDGDTFDAVVRDNDVGSIGGWKLSGTKKIRIRLIHVDTPELGDEGYEEATEDLADWLRDAVFDNEDLRVLANAKPDPWGRYVADVYPYWNRSDTASEHMLRHANSGDGWPAWTG